MPTLWVAIFNIQYSGANYARKLSSIQTKRLNKIGNRKELPGIELLTILC